MTAPFEEWTEMPLPAPDAAAWLSQQEDRGVFGALALDHVGVAVRDVDEAIDRFSRWLGLHDWTRATFSQTATYRGTPQVIGGTVATAKMGPIGLELVMPTQGMWTPMEVLDTKGEGLYHLGFRVADLAAALQSADEAGGTPGLVAETAGVPVFSYSNSEDLHGITIELISPRMPNGMVTSLDIVH